MIWKFVACYSGYRVCMFLCASDIDCINSMFSPGGAAKDLVEVKAVSRATNEISLFIYSMLVLMVSLRVPVYHVQSRDGPYLVCLR